MVQSVQSVYDAWARIADLINEKRFREAVAVGAAVWERRNEADSKTYGKYMLDYAVALGRSGQYERAIATLREALDRPDLPPRLRAGITENLGFFLAKAGHLKEGIAHLRKARHLAVDLSDGFNTARLDYLIGRWLLRAGNIEEARERLEMARAVLDSRGDVWTAWAQVYHAKCLLALGYVTEAEDLAARHRDGDLEVAAAAMIVLAQVAIARGDVSLAQDRVAAAKWYAIQCERDDLYREADSLISERKEAAHAQDPPGAHGHRSGAELPSGVGDRCR